MGNCSFGTDIYMYSECSYQSALAHSRFWFCLLKDIAKTRLTVVPSLMNYCSNLGDMQEHEIKRCKGIL